MGERFRIDLALHSNHDVSTQESSPEVFELPTASMRSDETRYNRFHATSTRPRRTGLSRYGAQSTHNRHRPYHVENAGSRPITEAPLCSLSGTVDVDGNSIFAAQTYVVLGASHKHPFPMGLICLDLSFRLPVLHKFFSIPQAAMNRS